MFGTFGELAQTFGFGQMS